MALSNMQVFNQYIMPATIETLGQMIEKFNQASGGAIVLNSTSFDGDFLRQAFFQSLASARRRVDRYSSNSTVSAVDLTELQMSTVKIAGGFGPVRYEPSQQTWLNRPNVEGVEAASRAFAELLLQDQLNTSILAARAAIANQSDATNDVSASAGVSYTELNNAHAKFGDSSGNIIANVMTGSVYHKLIGLNISNAQQLFRQGDVTVVDMLGKLIVVTDAPGLYVSGTPNKAYILGLVGGGVVCHDSGDVITNIDTTNGKDRIETTFQADYSFGLTLKGYTWDETNGGKSPTDAEIGTGSNWEKVATDIKHTAGVVLVANAAL